jgi:hypothetical protein
VLGRYVACPQQQVHSDSHFQLSAPVVSDRLDQCPRYRQRPGVTYQFQ